MLRPTFSEMDLVPNEAHGHSFVAIAWDENLEPVSQRPNCILNFPKHELVNLAGTQAWEKDFQGWFTPGRVRDTQTPSGSPQNILSLLF